MLNDLKDGRTTFDNSDTEQFFGSIRVNYRTVQNKINNKYDQWHKEILNQFGKTLKDSIEDFNSTLEQARAKLERINFSSGADIVVGISDLQFAKRNLRQWNESLTHFKEGEKLLNRQRYHFPDNWMYFDQLEGRWIVFKQIYTQKTADFDKQFEILRQKLEAEEQGINDKIKNIEAIREEKKPFQGNLKPKQALEVLNMIDTKLADVADQLDKLNKAKELMDL